MQSKPLALLAAGAIAVLIATGCTKSSDQSSSTTSTTTTQTAAPGTTSSQTAATSGVSGDTAHGKTIFGTNCSACHGATGTEGGIGPSLKNEKSRKNYEQTIAWIKNPQPPMPKLYPSPLSEKDVDDVAAYVEGL